MKPIITVCFLFCTLFAICCPAQVVKDSVVRGQFIQFRFTGEVYASDAYNLGVGNCFVKVNQGNVGMNASEAFLNCDTIYEVDELEFDEEKCLKAANDSFEFQHIKRDTVFLVDRKLIRKLNKYSLAKNRINEMLYQYVELDLRVKSVQRTAYPFVNTSFRKNRNGIVIMREVVVVSLKCG